jgi:outer membrane protein TolC
MKMRFTEWRFLVCAAGALVAGLCFSRAQTVGVTNYPIDLPTALRLANARSLDVQIARERLKEAKANHDSAVEQFFPAVTPGIGYHRRDGQAQAVPAGTISDAHFQSYSPGAIFAAQVDFGDAIYKSLAAKQLANAAAHGLQSQSQDTSLAAAQGYFDLAKARADVDVVSEALHISQDYQNQLHEAVGAGIAFRGDELRVQVQTQRHQLALRRALEQQRIEAARLAQVLHLDPSVELIPQPADLVPLALVETNATLDRMVQLALRSRPELKQNQALVSAARDAKNGAVYGPLIPSLNAQVFLGGLGGGPEDGPDTFGHSQDYLVGLGWRIGPGGLFDAGRVHATEARLEAFRLGGEKTRDAVIREVVESHTRVQSLRDQIETARQNVATASETLRLARERKQFGVGAVLEDLQAQEDLTQSQANYLEVIAEFDKAQYSLVKATGGLAEAR